MGARLLRSADHRRMPWKNGGGETVEIAVFPEGSALADFGWRVSMASVASDGPFSVFPGIDRTLAVLSGDGMALTIEGIGERLLTTESEPLGFPADARTTARLTSGLITDLNVMTRRGRFAHRMSRHACEGPLPLLPEGGSRFVLALDPIGVSTADGLIGLQPLDAILLDAGTPAAIVSVTERTSFYLIDIDEA